MLLLRRPGRAGAFGAAPVLSCLVLFVAPSKSAAMSSSESISASRCASGDLWRFVPTASCPPRRTTPGCPGSAKRTISSSFTLSPRAAYARRATFPTPAAPNDSACASSNVPHSAQNHVWRRHLHGTTRRRHRAAMLRKEIWVHSPRPKPLYGNPRVNVLYTGVYRDFFF